MQWSSKCLRTAALCAAFVCPAAFAFDGALDPSFGIAGISYIAPDGKEADTFSPSAVIELPDGKLLFGGTSYLQTEVPMQPIMRGMFARLNADGSADTSFGGPSIPGLVVLPSLVSGQRMQTVESIQRLADGSIVVAGSAFGEHTPRGFVAKIDANGSPDALFGVGGVVEMPDLHRVYSVGVDSQGRVVAAGDRVGGVGVISIAVRLLPDGHFDENFGNAGIVDILWSGDENLWGELKVVALTPDDRVIVGGSYEIPGEWPHSGRDYAIARLDATGQLDPSFAGTGWRVFHDPTDPSISNTVHRLLPLPDGRIAFAGDHLFGENQSGLVLGVLTADGSTDETFGESGTPGYLKPANPPNAQTATPTALVVQADGKFIVGASYYVEPVDGRKQSFFALRATSDGRLDTSFADNGVVLTDLAPAGIGSDLGAIGLQADGRILLAGTTRRAPDGVLGDLAVVRLLNEIPPPDRVFANGFESR